jgi:hypothetical protein
MQGNQPKRAAKLNFSFVCFLVLILPTILYASENEILFWNKTALDLVKKYSVPPPKASRMLGLLHVSMFEAANSAQTKYQPYEEIDESLQGVPAAVVAAQAAAYILAKEFPSEEVSIENLLSLRANTTEGGQGVAQRIHQNHPLEFFPMEDPAVIDGYVWEPTPPKYASYLLKEWCALKPLGIHSALEFRKKGPPSPDTSAFKSNLEEVKRIGERNSVVRTQDQTEIALFWADGAGTVTPPGHWNQIAADIIRQKNLDTVDAARVMALLNLALADAAIVAWDMKYVFQFARPVNVFQQDGWEPLIVTPPFPEYVSGHSTFSGAAARVLTNVFGNMAFSSTSDGVMGAIRNYTSFEHAAEEAGKSRIYGGIHFSFSDVDGRAAGSELADYIFKTHLKQL